MLKSVGFQQSWLQLNWLIFRPVESFVHCLPAAGFLTEAVAALAHP
jgi:hypothetical protein